MRGIGRGTITVLIVLLAAGCAPRMFKPVGLVDPVPLLEVVNTRRLTLEKGLSGTLELAFKNHERRFNSRVYIVAYPDGRFRLEIPGLLGGTILVMVNDGREILAYYPGENRAFRSAVDGRSINPHLPFPLPVDPTLLPALIMGVTPPGDTVSGARAWLLESGERLLLTEPGKSGLRYRYLFNRGAENALREITVRGNDMEVSIGTREGARYLPREFEITLAEGVLKGQWVEPFGGNETVLDLNLPVHVPVTDLEASP
jgi:hypothetical protein